MSHVRGRCPFIMAAEVAFLLGIARAQKIETAKNTSFSGAYKRGEHEPNSALVLLLHRATLRCMQRHPIRLGFSQREGM